MTPRTLRLAGRAAAGLRARIARAVRLLGVGGPTLAELDAIWRARVRDEPPPLGIGEASAMEDKVTPEEEVPDGR